MLQATLAAHRDPSNTWRCYCDWTYFQSSCLRSAAMVTARQDVLEHLSDGTLDTERSRREARHSMHTYSSSRPSVSAKLRGWHIEAVRPVYVPVSSLRSISTPGYQKSNKAEAALSWLVVGDCHFRTPSDLFFHQRTKDLARSSDAYIALDCRCICPRCFKPLHKP